MHGKHVHVPIHVHTMHAHVHTPIKPGKEWNGCS